MAGKAMTEEEEIAYWKKQLGWCFSLYTFKVTVARYMFLFTSARYGK